jgi:hypothetical protein
MKPVFHVSGRTTTSGPFSPTARRTSASARSKFALLSSERIFIWITLTFMVVSSKIVLIRSLYEKKACIAMHNKKRTANAVLFFAEKSLAEFYPQGICGIRKAAELLTAAQAPRTAQIN